MEYDNTNRGVLFKNDRKETEKHPDYKGSVNFNGQDCWLSAWLKDGKSGKFMSLSVTPKNDQELTYGEHKQVKVAAEQDVPF